MIIRNIDDLARSLHTSVPDLKDDVLNYSDYPTFISWDQIAVRLYTSVPESDRSFEIILFFPFSENDYDDAVSRLQCKADSLWCNMQKEGAM